MSIRASLLTLILLSSACTADTQGEQLAKRAGLPDGNQLSESKVASGLKEALEVGAQNAVKIVSKTDGYFGNAPIKILMPNDLRPLERGLRAVGFGSKIDQFVLSMNRSAEAAAPAARQIFVDAILAMSFDDARRILSGNDTAATGYFKEKTTGRLTEAFAPVVQKTMAQNGTARQYNALVDQYKSIPFAKSQNLDIDHYVVAKALDGLFYEVAEQEKQIRENPAARTTSLLKEVFGAVPR